MTREEALYILHNSSVYHPLYLDALNMAIEALEQEPKTGYWITKPHIYGVAFCSECGFELRIDDTKYCPNCGAKMDKEQKNE